jgi:hypothetical protein
MAGAARSEGEAGGLGKNLEKSCRRLSKSGFNCLSKSGQVFLMFPAA